ncbi:expressed unknown protein [Seminavis robusta]|uniref:Uncharacterized protein n=1 Tax=Seminavis robusta TaxID=568900 RepID=A0A9N8HGT2_9STRA|nr:expressed unknown protein [Seminavis robusta]|eukprot:Sro502_g155570.1 n/a (91) ;mRNA; f:30666-30938
MDNEKEDEEKKEDEDEKEDEEKKEMAEDEKMIDRLGRNWFTSDGLRHLIEGYHGPGGETILGIKAHHPYNYLCLPKNHAPFFDHMQKGKL